MTLACAGEARREDDMDCGIGQGGRSDGLDADLCRRSVESVNNEMSGWHGHLEVSSSGPKTSDLAA